MSGHAETVREAELHRLYVASNDALLEALRERDEARAALATTEPRDLARRIRELEAINAQMSRAEGPQRLDAAEAQVASLREALSNLVTVAARYRDTTSRSDLEDALDRAREALAGGGRTPPEQDSGDGRSASAVAEAARTVGACPKCGSADARFCADKECPLFTAEAALQRPNQAGSVEWWKTTCEWWRKECYRAWDALGIQHPVAPGQDLGGDGLSAVAVAEAFLQRIVRVCETTLSRIAEVGEPPAFWSGTQIDPLRMLNQTREVLTEIAALTTEAALKRPNQEVWRNPECVAQWPECVDGAYHPRCCRFPKSCSCEIPQPVAAQVREGETPE